VIVTSPAFFAILDSKRIVVTTWPFGVTWRHWSRDHSPWAMVVLWNEISISSCFRDIQWWMWCSGSRDLKRPV